MFNMLKHVSFMPSPLQVGGGLVGLGGVRCCFMQLVRDAGSFSLDLRIFCWILHIQKEGKWEGSGGLSKADLEMWKWCTSHPPISGQVEGSHIPSLKAREHVAFLYEHVVQSLLHYESPKRKIRGRDKKCGKAILVLWKSRYIALS